MHEANGRIWLVGGKGEDLAYRRQRGGSDLQEAEGRIWLAGGKGEDLACRRQRGGSGLQEAEGRIWLAGGKGIHVRDCHGLYCDPNKLWDYLGLPNKSHRLAPLESQSRQSQEQLGLLGTSREVPDAIPSRIPVLTVPRKAGTTWVIPVSPRG